MSGIDNQYEEISARNAQLTTGLDLDYCGRDRNDSTSSSVVNAVEVDLSKATRNSMSSSESWTSCGCSGIVTPYISLNVGR
jgi:hypothetical protein